MAACLRSGFDMHALECMYSIEEHLFTLIMYTFSAISHLTNTASYSKDHHIEDSN
jgi:hypothetical protein